MGGVKQVQPVLLFCGVIAAPSVHMADVLQELQAEFGVIDKESVDIPFTFTDYYQPEMGDGLIRKFLSFADLIDPGSLADIKLATNRIEDRHCVERDGVLCRMVNLDPGYLCASRIVLATTKDFAHRIYLREGIYAEVTANFRKDGMTFHPWSYPDFQSEAYQAVFLGMRKAYLARVSAAG